MSNEQRSKVLSMVHETAQGLTRAGVMKKQTMREFDELCLRGTGQISQSRIMAQIEQMRREAFAAGYAAAMQAVREQLALRAAPDVGSSAPRRPRRSAARGPRRGSNARMIEEILQSMAPRAVRPAEIRAVLQRDKGVSMAFTSIRHALGQLEARQAAEQIGENRSWRHRQRA